MIKEFNKSDVISQEYIIHILDKPSPSDMTALTINQDFYTDGLDLGSTTIQFYLTDFPEIESDVIPIAVKKGINGTKLYNR